VGQGCPDRAAIGHPLGASGGRSSAGKRYGLQTMCEGDGMANATIVERFN
jgi:acetyl-CoA acetyltransferase